MQYKLANDAKDRLKEMVVLACVRQTGCDSRPFPPAVMPCDHSSNACNSNQGCGSCEVQPHCIQAHLHQGQSGALVISSKVDRKRRPEGMKKIMIDLQVVKLFSAQVS